MLNGLDLFTGIGGITLALSEWVKPVAYCEIDPYCQSVILQRMQEGHLPKAPIWDDIRTLSSAETPSVDIVYGGFPCQDISIASHGAGLDGERSGLVFEIFRLLDETKAPFIFLENVPNIRTKGAERVCKELAERGYDCRWCCISAASVGALHKRERWFLLAHANLFTDNGDIRGIQRKNEKIGQSEEYREDKASKFTNGCHNVAYSSSFSSIQADLQTMPERTTRKAWCDYTRKYWPFESSASWQEAMSSICRTSDGIPRRMDRLRALGNAVVPIQAKAAFEILIGKKKEK